MPYRVKNIEEDLSRALFSYEEEKVIFRPLKPFDGLELAGIVVPRIDKKSVKKKIEIPRYMAEILQDSGFGVITSGNEININSVFNKLQEEQKSTVLEKTDLSFFLDVTKSISKKLIAIESDDRITDDLREARKKKITRMINDYGLLVQRRREKLLRKVGTLSDKEIRKRLTRSEKVLYQAISDILVEWETIVVEKRFENGI
ncbi:MAG: hypothetical protein ACTSRU_04595 [Candidatus Hodarchaeales archaeon]